MISLRFRVTQIRALAVLAIALMTASSALAQVKPSAAVVQQIVAIQQVKRSLTPAQKKMDSNLAFSAMAAKGDPSVQPLRSSLSPLAKNHSGKVVVDITARVSAALLQNIRGLGGDVLYESSRWNSIRAALSLANIEAIAARPDVARVASRALARTNVGSVTSQGYVAHRAKQVVEQQGINGGGVNVGILSDSASLAQIAALKGSGDLPPTAHVLPGQSGEPNTDEGAAMMEIVYDMAPGSNQIFATAWNGPASFADNIIALQAAGCKVIADDVGYSDEPVFQDGIIAQAVNQVTAAGATYLSSAGNSGSKLFGTPESWEGDFKDGGPVSGVIGTFEGGQGNFHDFGSNNFFDAFSAAGSGVAILQWSDRWGAACDDYDLFVTDAAGTVIKGVSAGTQNCTNGFPIEEIDNYPNPAAGDRIYVVLFSGEPRALHLFGWDATLALATNGNTYGHSAGRNTISMAATYWGSAKKGLQPFTGSANPVENFSSDGPRKIFFNPDGSPIMPGNLLFATSGGLTLTKPTLTATDGVFTKTGPPFFLPFFGTSASAPHAAGIAAMIVQVRPDYSPAQVTKAMTASALDAMAPGVDPNAGYGIAMANLAVKYAQTH